MTSLKCLCKRGYSLRRELAPCDRPGRGAGRAQRPLQVLGQMPLCVCLRAQQLRRGVWQHAFPILRGDCSWHSAAQAAHALGDVYTHSFIITQSRMVIKASARVERRGKDTVLEPENVREYITAVIKNKCTLYVFLPMSFAYLFMELFTIKAAVCSISRNGGRQRS